MAKGGRPKTSKAGGGAPRPGRSATAPGDDAALSRPAWDARTLLVLAVIGGLARVAVALVSWGTTDAYTWYQFAVRIDAVGLIEAYRLETNLNHPPIPAYWSWAAYRLVGGAARTVAIGAEASATQPAAASPASGAGAGSPGAPAGNDASGAPREPGAATPGPHPADGGATAGPASDAAPADTAGGPAADDAAADARATGGATDATAGSTNADTAADGDAAAETGAVWFSFVFRLPPILADGLTAWILWRFWRPRGGPTVAAGVVAAWSWSLCAILVSGYHCNTDPIYAMLCLACVYLIAERRAFGWGGLALAAAINVKITPVLLIPPLLLTCRTRGDAVRFLAGLGVGVAPFVPLVLALGPRFYQNVLAYNSVLDKWGVNFVMIGLMLPPGDLLRVPADWERHPINVYYHNARYLIFGLIGAWALLARFRPRWDAYEVAAVTFVLFLVLTAGFGVQYTVIPLPLLFAVRPRLAAAYGTVAGLFRRRRTS